MARETKNAIHASISADRSIWSKGVIAAEERTAYEAKASLQRKKEQKNNSCSTNSRIVGGSKGTNRRTAEQQGLVQSPLGEAGCSGGSWAADATGVAVTAWLGASLTVWLGASLTVWLGASLTVWLGAAPGVETGREFCQCNCIQ